jgi:hypothetical protein
VDLLEHEGLVAALLGGLVVPLDRLDGALNRTPRQRLDEARSLGVDLYDLAVLNELDVAGLGEEGRDGGGDEALALAQADDQRALLASAHEHARVVGGHRDERVVPAQLVVGEAHGLGQVAVQVLRDQVRHDLGVGLRGEPGAVGLEPLAQGGPVLHDSVERDVHAVRGVRVRVRVGLGHAAVRRPARVADPGRAAQMAVGVGDGVAQVLEVADSVDAADVLVGDQRQAGRVIAAVLETPQALEQKVAALARPYVSNDSAHDRLSVSTTRPFSPATARSPRTPPPPEPRP